MIWDRERYIAHCNFEFTGREMFCELFGLLIGRAHADLFPGKDLPELACLALEHGE